MLGEGAASCDVACVPGHASDCSPSDCSPSPCPAADADGRHVVFGRVLTGMDTIAKIGGAFLINQRPATPVFIRDAGRLPEAEWAAVDKVLAAQAKASAAKPAGAAAAPKKPAAASA